MLEIVHDCTTSNINCALSIITSAYTLSIIIFSLLCIINVFKFFKRYAFEMIPLSTALLQSIIQFIMNFFLEDIRLLLTSLYIQVITFSFVSLSFSLLYFRTNQNDKNKVFIIKTVQSIFALFMLLVVILMVVFAFTLSEQDCEQWFGFNYVLPIILSGFCVFVSLIFGYKLK